MSEWYWFLPLDNDVRTIGTLVPDSPEPTLSSLVDIASAAEDAGFEGMLVPAAYGLPFDTFTTASAVLAKTNSIKLLLAARPSNYHPIQAAYMLSSMMKLFPGRVELNVIFAGADPEENWMLASEDRALRRRRLQEWLEITRDLWVSDEPVSYNGQIYKVDGAFQYDPVEEPPRMFFSGPPDSQESAGGIPDVYLFHGAPVAKVEEFVQSVRNVKGPDVKIGLRLHVIVRPTEEEAWEAAKTIFGQIDLRVVEIMNQRNPRQPIELPPENLKDDLVEEGLLGGFGRVRLGVQVAVIGNPEQVAAKLRDYERAGVNVFILSGYSKQDEAKRFGELVMPILKSIEVR